MQGIKIVDAIRGLNLKNLARHFRARGKGRKAWTWRQNREGKRISATCDYVLGGKKIQFKNFQAVRTTMDTDHKLLWARIRYDQGEAKGRGLKAYRSYLRQHCLDMGMQLVDIALHLGKAAGDLMSVPFNQLQRPVDLLVAGPPCPPWSGQGSHKSVDDDRAKVFLRIIEWAIYLAHCGGLLCVVIENVPGGSELFPWRGAAN